MSGRQVLRPAAPNNDEPFFKVHVSNLGQNITGKYLYEVFRRCGRIKLCKVIHDEFGVTRGYAFIEFRDPDGAPIAIDTFNGVTLDGEHKPIFVTRYRNQRLRLQRQRLFERSATVHVRNLLPIITADDLRRMFRAFGIIISVRINITAPFQAEGFVGFSSPVHAEMAAYHMHGKTIGSRPIFVVVAQKRDEFHRQFLVRHPTLRPMAHPYLYPGNRHPGLPYQFPRAIAETPQFPQQQFEQAGPSAPRHVMYQNPTI